MSDKHDFRTVNRILGERPRLGPFPADQIFAWTLIAVVNVFIFNYLLKTSWLGTSLSIAWGWATWWTISTNKDFFGKFVSVPRISRGYMRHKPIRNGLTPRSANAIEPPARSANAIRNFEDN